MHIHSAKAKHIINMCRYDVHFVMCILCFVYQSLRKQTPNTCWMETFGKSIPQSIPFFSIFAAAFFPFSKSQVSQQRLAANQMGRGDVSMPPFTLESESQNSKLCFCSSGVNEIGVIVSPFPTKNSNRATHRNRIWFDDVLYCPVNWKKWNWVLNIFIFSHYCHPLESQFFFWKYKLHGCMSLGLKITWVLDMIFSPQSISISNTVSSFNICI